MCIFILPVKIDILFVATNLLLLAIGFIDGMGWVLSSLAIA
jgi:hypothetical protein